MARFACLWLLACLVLGIEGGAAEQYLLPAEQGSSSSAVDGDVEDAAEGAEDDDLEDAQDVLDLSDTDNDGKVSVVDLIDGAMSDEDGTPIDDNDLLWEVMGKLEKHYTSCDKDGDGLLDSEEVTDLLARLREDDNEDKDVVEDEESASSAVDGGNKDAVEGDGDEDVPEDPQAVLDLSDTNKDGKVSKAELLDGAVTDEDGNLLDDDGFLQEMRSKFDKHFAPSDKDGDGLLDVEEVTDLLTRLREDADEDDQAEQVSFTGLR